jgi:hypothetical protein
MEAPPSPLSSRAYPDFLLRGTKDDLVCGFHQGKPHELCGTHRTQQEIRGSRGICSSADLSWKCFSTERTRISCCAAVDRAACAVFRKVVHRRSRPAGYETGHFLSSAAQQIPGCPSPRISCKAWWGPRTSCGFPYRKPHTLPWLGPRSRKSGVLRSGGSAVSFSHICP